MTTRIYTINKRDLTKEEKEKVSRYYRGLRALSDTITERVIDDDGKLVYEETRYIFVGSWTPYDSCVKHGDRYVFARYSRYDSLSVDFTDFAIDTEETGEDHKVFDTKHFKVENMTVKY